MEITVVGMGYVVPVLESVLPSNRAHVDAAGLVGANREYVEKALPHIASLLRHDLEMVLKDADLVIVAQPNPAYSRICELVTDRPVLDLAGAARPAIAAANYHGLSGKEAVSPAQAQILRPRLPA